MRRIAALAAGLLLLALGSAALAGPPDAPLISPGQAQELLGKPGVVFIDVRSARDWDLSDRMIKGAQRRLADRVATWAPELDKDATYIVYCA